MDRLDLAEMRIKQLQTETEANATNIGELLGIIKDGQKIAKSQNELHKLLAKRVDLQDSRLKAFSENHSLRMLT